MISVFLLCLLILALGLLAGLRLGVVLREQRRTRRGGYLIAPSSETATPDYELVKWKPW